MIKKITVNEYQKRYDNMTGVERQVVTDRVGQWLSRYGKMLLRRAEEPEAQLQNVMQVSGRWNDEECRAWEEGAQLLSSFASMADTWLPDRLYGKAAYRSIRRMVKCLKTMGEPDGAMPVALQGENPVVQGSRFKVQGDKPAGKPTGTVADKPSGKGADKQHKHNDKGGGAAAPYNQEPKGAAGAATAQTGGTPLKPDAIATGGSSSKFQVSSNDGSAVIPRPRHIDQYVHILPKKTQERAAKYGDLMRGLEEARENMRRLMTDPMAKNSDREKWAKTATSIDTQIKSIRKELDKEWEKAVADGRVTVDDLGNAHVVSGFKVQGSSVAELTKEQKVRVKQLRNALRETRGPKEPGKKHDAYVKKWIEKYREMVSIGGQQVVTEAVEKAAKLYGIDLAKI